MNNTTEVLGMKISNRSMKSSVKWIFDKAKLGKGMVVYCCTLNEVMMAENDIFFKKMFETADLITADGMPLVWGMRFKIGKGERVYGPDLMKEIVYKNKGNQIFVGDEKNRKYFEKLGKYIVMPMKKKFSDVDYEHLSGKIKKMQGAIVWLGLGAEKQVITAYELKERGVKRVFITVGAAFDFLSGNKRQAPAWIRNMGCEWLFRLINEPKRLIGRYFRIICFLGRFFLKKYRK